MFSDMADGSGGDYDEPYDNQDSYDESDMSGSGHTRKSLLILSYIILISFLYLFNLLISLLDLFD